MNRPGDRSRPDVAHRAVADAVGDAGRLSGAGGGRRPPVAEGAVGLGPAEAQPGHPLVVDLRHHLPAVAAVEQVGNALPGAVGRRQPDRGDRVGRIGRPHGRRRQVPRGRGRRLRHGAFRQPWSPGAAAVGHRLLLVPGDGLAVVDQHQVAQDEGRVAMVGGDPVLPHSSGHLHADGQGERERVPAVPGDLGDLLQRGRVDQGGHVGARLHLDQADGMAAAGVGVGRLPRDRAAVLGQHHHVARGQVREVAGQRGPGAPGR